MSAIQQLVEAVQMLTSHLSRLVPLPPPAKPRCSSQPGLSGVSSPAAGHPPCQDASPSFELHSLTPVRPALQTPSPACLASGGCSHHSQQSSPGLCQFTSLLMTILIAVVLLQLVLCLPPLIFTSVLPLA